MPRRLTLARFIEKASALHGNKYDYSKAIYINNKTLITVICTIHGEFYIRPSSHIEVRTCRGESEAQGCQECWKEKARWTEEKILECAKKFKTRSEFQNKSKGAYLSALRKGILEKVCAHMERQIAPRGHWDLKNCQAEAEKYESRSEFQNASGSAYNSALEHGWLDEICGHMAKGADGYHYMVYAIINERLKKAYVGITKQHFEARMGAHRKGGNTRATEIAMLADTEFIKCTQYVILSTELKDAEGEWALYYHKKDYEVLNDKRLYGRTGVSRRIYTDEIIAQEAMKYTRRVDFKNGSPRHYDAAVSQRILGKVCSHMRKINEKNFWTKERCLEFATSCNNRDEFINNAGAYGAARDNGWVNEIWEKTGMRSKYDMSWLRPGTRKEIWCRADNYYLTWEENQRCGTDRMKSLTGHNLDKLLKKFKKGWIPTLDEDWIRWASVTKEELIKSGMTESDQQL